MEVIHALQSVSGPALDRLMLSVTQLGSEQVYIALLLILYLGVDARVGRRLAVYFLAGVYLNEQLKGLIDSPRPFQLDPGVLRSQAALATATGSGFPSGHAQASTVFYGLGAAYARRWWMTLVAVLVVLLVSVSRLYLGLHLPIDVVGGILIGAALVAAALALDRLRLRPARAAMLVLGLAVPFLLHVALPTTHSGVVMGAMAAFLTGPELLRHEASGSLAGRSALVALGLAIVFGAQAAISALVPDDVRHGLIASFLRYLAIGYLGTLLLPWLGRVLRLTPVLPAHR